MEHEIQPWMVVVLIVIGVSIKYYWNRRPPSTIRQKQQQIKRRIEDNQFWYQSVVEELVNTTNYRLRRHSEHYRGDRSYDAAKLIVDNTYDEWLRRYSHMFPPIGERPIISGAKGGVFQIEIPAEYRKYLRKKKRK